MEEKEAITRLKKGDWDALEPLIDQYYLKAVRAAYLIVLDQAQAEDIAQMSFIHAAERISIPESWASSLVKSPKPTYELPLWTATPEQVNLTIEVDKTAITLAGCSQNYSNFICQASAVEKLVGYKLLFFSNEPAGAGFSNFTIQQNNVVVTRYHAVDGWIDFYQGRAESFDYFTANAWEKAPADQIEPVKIGSNHGEYVSGHFVLSTVSSANQLIWSNDDGFFQRLGWKAGDKWYMIEESFEPYSSYYLDKEKLISLAESLVEPDRVSKPTLDPLHLNSINNLKKLTGFHILTPYVLPKDFYFSSARYDSESKSVVMVYDGSSGQLIIKQNTDKDYALQDISEIYPKTKKVTLRHSTGIYANVTDNPSSTLWMEEGENVLYWREGDLTFKLIYIPNHFFGGQLNEDGLIRIANGLS